MILRVLIVLGLAALGLYWGLTRPEYLSAEELQAFTPDAVAGEAVFHAAGCAACRKNGSILSASA